MVERGPHYVFKDVSIRILPATDYYCQHEMIYLRPAVDHKGLAFLEASTTIVYYPHGKDVPPNNIAFRCDPV